jgi:hypothetical protein
MLPLVCACAIGAAAVPTVASAKLTVGISDNSPAMFTSPEFLRTHITTARDVVLWNIAVLKDTTYLSQARQWLAAAQAAHVTPMISFAGNGNYIPSAKVYTAAIKAFINDFPQVKIYTPWNEPDWIYRPALAKHPTLAASYFNALVQSCHRCTIVAGDVYLAANHGLAAWVKAYSKGLHYKPAAWALHPYDDVRGHNTKQIRAFQSVTKGSIWFDEISGVLTRGHWQYKNQSAAAAGRDESYLFALPKQFPRITRIYHYQWQGTPTAPWDSGLLGPTGLPRPAYSVVYNAAHGKLP